MDEVNTAQTFIIDGSEHQFDFFVTKTVGLQVGKAPKSVAKTWFGLISGTIGQNRLVRLVDGFKGMRFEQVYGSRVCSLSDYLIVDLDCFFKFTDGDTLISIDGPMFYVAGVSRQ